MNPFNEMQLELALQLAQDTSEPTGKSIATSNDSKPTVVLSLFLYFFRSLSTATAF
jgi:hypothetical protein